MPTPKKKKVEDGAPAYFGLFCSLMTVLLAFFILMTAMADEQESGFHKGIGDIRNAFGIRGGFGLFTYAHLVRGNMSHRTPEEFSVDDGLDALHEDMVAGKGGGGNTDVNTTSTSDARYLRVRIPHPYPTSEHLAASELGNFLQIAGTALALLEYEITIKAYNMDQATEAENCKVAFERAVAVTRYINTRCRVPHARLKAVGYTTLPSQGLPEGCSPDEPALWIDIYRPPQTEVPPRDAR